MAVCGIGGTTLPGDPDNSSVLNAEGADRGIRISWTYPGFNPHAVAFFELYRSTASVQPTTPFALATSTVFHDLDALNEGTTYYYWLRMVSINGTYFDSIGPVFAKPGIKSETVKKEAGNSIDGTWLDETLNSEIQDIGNNRALLDQEIIDRSQNDDDIQTQLNQVIVDNETSMAMITEESLVRSSETSSLSTQITTFKSELDGEVSTIQTNFTTFVNRVDGNIESGAKFSMKMDVNNLIGGMAITNTGTAVSVGFDVDEFYVGRTKWDGTKEGTKPFRVVNGVTYIEEASIENGTIDMAKISDVIQSWPYYSGSTGWRIEKSGKAYFNEVVISRPNIAAEGTWINPDETSNSEGTAHFSASDDPEKRVLLGIVDTGYDNVYDVRDTRGPAITARVYASEGEYWWNGTQPGNNDITSTVDVECEIMFSADFYAAGASGPQGGRILLVIYARKGTKWFSDITSRRLDKVKWSISEVT